MANPRYKMGNLSFKASQVKRTIINRAKKGIYLDKMISKTDALKRIAKSLKLSSHRSLYDKGEREQYINNWFNKLVDEVDAINNKLINPNERVINEEYKNVEELLILLDQERKIRKAYETRIQNLMEENESLRVGNLNHFKKIDRD